MRRYETDSDCGAIMLGTKEFGALFSNGYGDGVTVVKVYDKDERFDFDKGDYTFIDTVEGKFNLYSYDCCHNRDEEDIVATFNGRYGVYRGNGLRPVCVIEQWEDWSK